MSYFQKIVFNCKDWFRNGSKQAQKESLAYEKLNGDSKKELDWLNRKTIVRFAYENIPFYRKYYSECNFEPSMLKAEEDWQLIPILEKKSIAEYGKEFLLPGVSTDKLSIGTTGGSTGKPLKFYKDPAVHFESLHWRAMRWYDCYPWDNVGIVNRRVPQNRFQLIKNRLLWWPTKRCYLDASSVSAQSLRKFLHEINALKIKYLTGYCGSLEMLADYAIEHKIETPTLKMVWSTTNPLRKDVRIRMEQAFGCAIMDQYGCCEMPNIAVQKKGEDFLTVNSDYVHIDFVDDNNCLIKNSLEDGDLLITDLQTTVFPIIKYRLGDRGHLVSNFENSADGFPKISPIQGRITDAMLFEDGTFIDGAYLTTVCDNYSTVVASYQIYQHLDYTIEMKIVLKPGVAKDNKAISEIYNTLNNKIAGRTTLTITFCENIPHDRGKRRYIISELALKKQNR